ncbi:hypothetical protein [Streptomyces sp. cg36]|uniref:hypothetical protein n=1 Tax=Streptomyces sp. cg36 TaxID=3238798 RepID=UPI0034E1F0F5
METNTTALLLDLAARAQRVGNPDTLRALLRAGHRAWCAGLADVQTGVTRQSASVSDAELARRCAAAGTGLWETDMTREETLSALSFATWDATPAALAYTELEERAALFGVSLVGEEIL